MKRFRIKLPNNNRFPHLDLLLNQGLVRSGDTLLLPTIQMRGATETAIRDKGLNVKIETQTPAQLQQSDAEHRICYQGSYGLNCLAWGNMERLDEGFRPVRPSPR